MKKKNNLTVMLRLLKLVMPLFGMVFLAVILGVIGHLAAIMIPVLGILILFEVEARGFLIMMLLLCGFIRAIMRYGEQASNHYLAFRTLAEIRHHVFNRLRLLAPAKLETKNRGDLIALITSDIELLEVFYAHTITPILIALIVNGVVLVTLGKSFSSALWISVPAYGIVGIIIPLVFSKMGQKDGEAYRQAMGDMNTFVLDSVRGVNEIMQYRQGTQRMTEMDVRRDALNLLQYRMQRINTLRQMLTEATILVSLGLVFFQGYQSGNPLSLQLLVLVLHASSFGPLISLANLSGNMHHTLASARRVLNLMDEAPIVDDVIDGQDYTAGGVVYTDVSFAYEQELVLEHLNAQFDQGKTISISGRSGEGKSTLLRLLMRFWESTSGRISIDNKSVDIINSQSLRNGLSFMGQSTDLFMGTIRENIAIGKLNATDEEIKAAAIKASIHDFIISLKDGYATQIGELGESLSSGERQRIGLSRIFLHNGSLFLLDEPTSNLDSLNEAIILRNLYQFGKEKSIIITSHRESSQRIADEKYVMKNGKLDKKV